MPNHISHRILQGILAKKYKSLVAGIFAILSMSAEAIDLQTKAEKTEYRETGRYEEVVRLCDSYSKHFPKYVRCQQFGLTPEGRPMLVLIASKTGALSASQAKRKGIPVVLIQGGIHAGEIDGKDAGFLALQEMLSLPNSGEVLRKQVLLFVPVFNIDGHERFGPNNRPNQRGPLAMGWRTTAQNFNLNRDYLKADAPEMQAMLALINTWDPVATIDLHVTDGAKFQHDVSIQVEPSLNKEHPLAETGRQLQDAVIEDLAQRGSLPLAFYMSFDEEDNPMSGFSNNVSTPRFSTGYFQLRNRLAMLVETHSWKDYPTRVKITKNAIDSVLKQIALHGATWRQLQLQADLNSSRMANQKLALSYKNTELQKNVEFKGYAYNRSLSEISGAPMTRYDEGKPEVWRVKLQDEVVADVSTVLPKAGYLVPAAWAKLIAPKLQQHAIQFRTLSKTSTNVELESFRAQQISFSPVSIEHHQMLKIEGQWAIDRQDILAGSIFIPVAQPKIRLVASMFEPLGGDSLLNWGWFNNAFEPKEYMEAYVAEEYARESLQNSAELRAEFEHKLQSDSAFKNDPAQRLNFFAKRHPSWDKHYGLYPVLRLIQEP